MRILSLVGALLLGGAAGAVLFHSGPQPQPVAVPRLVAPPVQRIVVTTPRPVRHAPPALRATPAPPASAPAAATVVPAAVHDSRPHPVARSQPRPKRTPAPQASPPAVATPTVIVTAAVHVPPGQAKKAAGNVPPGQAKKQNGNIPPGLAKKGNVPPGHSAGHGKRHGH